MVKIVNSKLIGIYIYSGQFFVRTFFCEETMAVNGLPSGKLTQLWKDPPSLMGKLTLNGPNSYVNFQRVVSILYR